jgi:HAD superfamily hydrolase (TIGR01484 family)
MPFLVATDLDGTLLRRDFTVSQRTRRALVAAADSGVAVVYATGRPPRWLAAVYETTGYRPITVCANGALTLHGDQALHVEAIPEEVAEEVRQVLLRQRTDFVFRSETWRGHTLKLLAVLPEVDQQHADTVLQEVRAVAGHLVEPTHSTHSQLLIEMGPGGVTKANAVQRLRRELWPDHTLIAVGDMPNDESLLRSADLAMTVETGHPWLRDVAQRVLPGPQDDGVAQLLEELVARTR